MPRHPASNGQAEALVKVVKSALKRRKEGSLQTRLSRFLLCYRTSPQSTTGRAPAELMFGRALRTSLETLRPSTRTAVESRQATMKEAHDRRAQDRSFSTGDALLLWDPQRHQTRWMTGEVIAVVLSRAAQ